MIAALLLALTGVVLVFSHRTLWAGDAIALFVIVPACIWLMSGGGDRWLQRREQRRR